MLLHHALAAGAQRAPGKVALVSGHERITYGDLQRRVAALAGVLRDGGIGPGERVLTLLENGIDFAVGVQAVLAAGAVVVPVSPLAKPDKLAFISRDARASALLTHHGLASTWRAALPAAGDLRRVWVAGAEGVVAEPRLRAWPTASGRGCPDPDRRPEDLALLVYTSGTTGVPKGVMHTHASIASAWAAIGPWLGLRDDDVIGLVLPTAFTYGLTNLLMGLVAGATVLLDRSAAFPVRLAETFARERVTVLPGVPTLFAALLGLQDLSRFDLAALRLVTNAAAALPHGHALRLRTAWPRARLVPMYGLTECIRASYLPPEELEQRPGSVGKGIPGQFHWLVDEGGKVLPPGSTGELLLSGPHVMQGYWERPAETAQRLGFGIGGERVLHTGDLFRTDADGYLHFVSRMDDIIKTRGEKVAPREVEEAIFRLEGVSGCAVVGIADEALGQAIKAYVTLNPGSGLDVRAIARHCLSRLESYMLPRQIEIVDELPRTESGKIRHASLR